MNGQVVSIPRAATKLGVSRWQIRQLVKQHRLRGIALGAKAMRVRYVSESSLNEFMGGATQEVNHV